MQVLTRKEYLATDAGAQVKKELQLMASSSNYDTKAIYSADDETKQAFVNRHLTYLIKHPSVSSVVYLSNLRVMTRSKR
jgi:hypothetical protein